MTQKIPVEVSARHMHISQEDLEKLFGKNYKLTKLQELSQPKEFASNQKVELINDKEKLKIRIVGPVRKSTQIELAITDAITLKLKPLPEIRISGDIKETTGITIKGPKGKINIKQGVIIAKRHLHLTEKDAKDLGLKNTKTAKIKILGKRSLTFDNIAVRPNNESSLALHIDTDEGNAAGINLKTKGELVK